VISISEATTIAAGSMSAADKTKLAGIAAGAEINVQPDWNQTLNTADDFIKNKPTIPAAADGSETKINAGTNVTITGSGTTASPYVVNATGGSGATHTIGESYGGGIVFYVYDNGQHGLIAATADQVGWVNWTNNAFSSEVSNAVRDGVKGGLMNTERIIIQAGAGSYAAQLCSNYQGGNFADWYLPSKYELNLLYLQKNIVGGFVSDYYWSSNESGADYAWYQNFESGNQEVGPKAFLVGSYGYVRAIRSF
jgi:hypothetical protein